MSKRLRLLIIGLGLFLVACTSEGTPNSFADQDNRIERQFVTACVAAQPDDEDATDFCECAFYTAANSLGLEGFLELDEALRENPDGLSLEQRQLFEGVSLPCQLSEEDVPETVISE